MSFPSRTLTFPPEQQERKPIVKQVYGGDGRTANQHAIYFPSPCQSYVNNKLVATEALTETWETGTPGSLQLMPTCRICGISEIWHGRGREPLKFTDDEFKSACPGFC